MARASTLAEAMQTAGCGIKLGLEFFSLHGPHGIREIRDEFPDLPLFLDLKFHDIPNTVAGAVRAATNLNVTYMTLHAAGGAEMMRAANDAAQDEAHKHGITPPQLLAVTVLTSLDNQALESVGQKTPSDDQVLRLATLTKQSGLSGIVCSGLDIVRVRTALGHDLTLMVPGIRPAGAATQDQKRVMTPADAMKAGATHLVIGRPITGADDPGKAAQEIKLSLSING